MLGMEIQDLDESKSQIAHGETVRETANMISFLSDYIGIRDDMYLGEGNKYMREVGEALDDGFKNGVLPKRPGIVNLQCDIDHPTQSMADLQHLVDYFGSLKNLKGKKIAVSWAYSPSYGKPLSVPQGIIGLMTRFGMDVSLAYPKGYNLIPEVEELAKKQAEENGGSFKIVDNMEDAFKDADIIYPKSWAAFHVMEKRTELLKNKDTEGLKKLEQEALAENANFKNWTVDDKMVSLTKDGKALYMHPLPADISGLSCEEGEVTNEVFDKYRIDTYKEAGHKPYIIASMMFVNKFKNPAKALSKILKRNKKRFGI
jgi:knotted carbamoyltransferase YgeW